MMERIGYQVEADMNRIGLNMKRTWFLAYVMCLLTIGLHAAAPQEWDKSNIERLEERMVIRARVFMDGEAVKMPGSVVAVFMGDDLRAVKEYDDSDGYYYYNLTVYADSDEEEGYTFKFYDSVKDKVYDLKIPDGMEPLPYKKKGYGQFATDGSGALEPFVLTLPTYAVEVVNGTAEPARACAGDSVEVTAVAPGEHKIFKEWTSNDGVEFGNENALKTTFVMPAKDVTVTAVFEDDRPYDYTVVNGTMANGKAYAGVRVNIEAPDRTAEHLVFTGWTGSGGVTFANPKALKTSFVMPAKDVTVTANYVQEGKVRYVVVNGTTTGGEDFAGTVISVEAKAPAAHKTFKEWRGDDVTFANPKSERTTFVLPQLDDVVTVTAVFDDEPQYDYTVVYGTPASGKAYKNDPVAIKAKDRTDEHLIFDKWTGDVTFTDASSPETTFTMPENAVTVTATYKDEPKYTITINGGTSDKAKAYAGETITVTANEPPEGETFRKWTGDVAFDDASSTVTRFTMPAKNVVVTANFSGKGGVVFRLESARTTVKPGDVVSVRLIAENHTGKGLISFSCNVNFNAADLAYYGEFDSMNVVNTSEFSYLSGGDLAENGISDLYGITLDNTLGADGEAIVLATMKFVVQKTASDNINIDLSNIDGGVIGGTIHNGNLDIDSESLTLSVEGGTADVPEFDIEFAGYQQTLTANVAIKVGMMAGASYAFKMEDGDMSTFGGFLNAYDIRVIDGRRDEDLHTDIRGLANREVWSALVTVPKGQTYTLDWSEAELPDYFAFSIVKGRYYFEEETVSMTDVKNMTFTEGETFIRIIADKKASVIEDGSFTFNLTPGWNLIGIPFTLDDESIMNLGSAVNVYAYDEEARAYVHRDSETFEAGRSYWVYARHSMAITVKALRASAEPEAVILKAGWNWVTPLKDSVLTMPDAPVSAVWFYMNGGYHIVKEDADIVLGRGYWIYSDEDTTIWPKVVNPSTALYMVVDLSGGPDAENYPVRYTNTAPDLDDDTCRTTELWLRRIPKGTFIMGSPTDELGHEYEERQHEETLTEDYYVGVFECTQKQYRLVMGRSSLEDNFDCCPMCAVTYFMIRGSSATAGAGWPEYGHAVDASSFMGKLQAKTGKVFDLPTEAQWEYACRAGTTTAFNSGKNLTSIYQDPAMDEVGRYGYNANDGKGGYSAFTKVGCYLPNAWGLYDMHGNVWEWCLDLYEYEDADPEEYIRILRGGSWCDRAVDCRASMRFYLYPSIGDYYKGFRIVCLP